MSIREFHAQLVSGNNKNQLFAALRKLSALTDPSCVISTTNNDWPLWEGNVSQPAALPA